eukprot:scaffold824_cov327-Pavlova_lutheri.AAC.21
MECVRALDRSDLCAARHLIVPGGTADPRSALGGLDEKSGRRDVERRVRVRNAPCHQATGVVRSRKLSIVRNVSLKRTSSGRRRARSARFLVVHTPSRSRPWIYAPDLRAHVLGRGRWDAWALLRLGSFASVFARVEGRRRSCACRCACAVFFSDTDGPHGPHEV